MLEDDGEGGVKGGGETDGVVGGAGDQWWVGGQ